RAVFVRLAEILIVFLVVRNPTPHPEGLEVVVRAEEQRLALDPVLVRGRDETGVARHDLPEQADRRIGADDSLVHAAPLVVQVALGVGRGPVVGLDIVDRWLVAGFRALVGIVARDTAPNPVAGGIPPTANARV